MTRPLEQYRQILAESHWFAALPAAMQQAMLQHARWIQLGTGEFLFQRGDASDGVYAVLDGAMNVGAVDAQGKEALLVVAEPVMWFGEICLVDDLPRTHDAVAAMPTTLLKLDQQAFRAILNSQPEYWRYIALLLSQKLRLVLHNVESLALHPAAQRLAQRLMQISEGYGHRDTRQPVIRLSQERLALMMSLSRQTINTLLRRFEAQGIIRLGFAEIVILDFDGLAQQAGEGFTQP